jgi:hypothetical protein
LPELQGSYEEHAFRPCAEFLKRRLPGGSGAIEGVGFFNNPE